MKKKLLAILASVLLLALLTLPAAAEKSGPVAFWRALYATIRTAEPFPISLDDVVEAIRYLQLVKQASPFAK